MSRLHVAARRRINRWREHKLAEGLLFEGVVFDADASAQRNIQAALTLFNADPRLLPADHKWRVRDNSLEDMPLDRLNRLGGAMMERAQRLYAYSWALKDHIETLNTADEIEASLQTKFAEWDVL
jgi:hypothetical protein